VRHRIRDIIEEERKLIIGKAADTTFVLETKVISDVFPRKVFYGNN